MEGVVLTLTPLEVLSLKENKLLLYLLNCPIKTGQFLFAYFYK
jgi:hypothetical protein